MTHLECEFGYFLNEQLHLIKSLKRLCNANDELGVGNQSPPSTEDPKTLSNHFKDLCKL